MPGTRKRLMLFGFNSATISLAALALTAAAAAESYLHAPAVDADFSPDGRTLYWSSGETGAVYFYDVSSREQVAEVSLNIGGGGRKFEDSYAVDVKVSGDGKFLYCADVTNFRLVVINTERREVVGSVPVGRYPYALSVVGNRV